MITCVSANPAIDRRLRVESIAVGEVNRAVSVRPLPGGKGEPLQTDWRKVKTGAAR